jgi:hypothetical protein
MRNFRDRSVSLIATGDQPSSTREFGNFAMEPSRQSPAEFDEHAPSSESPNTTSTHESATSDLSPPSPLSALFFSTNVSHPFRNLLLVPENDAEIRETVQQHAKTLVHSDESLSFADIAARIQERLCGPEPLTTSQLVRFLDTLTWTNRRMLADLVSRTMQGGTDPAATSTRLVASSAETRRHQADEPATAPQTSISGLTLAAARSSPDQVRRKLKALAALEAETPEMARWFQLVELTGATTDELARYFALDQRTVEQAVGKAIHTILKSIG